MSFFAGKRWQRPLQPAQDRTHTPPSLTSWVWLQILQCYLRCYKRVGMIRGLPWSTSRAKGEGESLTITHKNHFQTCWESPIFLENGFQVSKRLQGILETEILEIVAISIHKIGLPLESGKWPIFNIPEPWISILLEMGWYWALIGLIFTDHNLPEEKKTRTD